MLIDLSIPWHLSIVSLLDLIRILSIILILLKHLFTIELSQLRIWLVLIVVCFAMCTALI